MTLRQQKILAALISEYLDSTAEVGSSTLVSNYDLGVSSATVRSEMVQLTKQGYLQKDHSSAGRKPTVQGFRKFIQELLDERDINHLDEVKVRQNIHNIRHSRDRLIREAVQQLASLTRSTVVALAEETMYYSGVGYLVAQPEFRDVDTLRRVVNVIEDYDMLSRVFAIPSSDDVKVIIGNESGIDALSECSVVYKNFDYFRGEKGIISVIGPKRMNYGYNIPAVRFVSDVISNAISGW